MAKMEGFVIVPPISPWDEEHRVEIELDNAKRTFGATPAEAWRRHIGTNHVSAGAGEFARRVQHWHDRGYRVRSAVLEISEAETKIEGQ
jgi:hypothetical protein